MLSVICLEQSKNEKCLGIHLGWIIFNWAHAFRNVESCEGDWLFRYFWAVGCQFGFCDEGAIAVAFIPFQKAVRQPHPKTVYGEAIQLPKNTKIDRKLILGSLLFGIGWGIAGICPAPSFTLIGLGYYQAIYFIIAMFVGVLLHRKVMEKMP